MNKLSQTAIGLTGGVLLTTFAIRELRGYIGAPTSGPDAFLAVCFCTLVVVMAIVGRGR